MPAGSRRPSVCTWTAFPLVMVGVITGVGFLIHLYATGYMAEEEGYSRFFAYMNLFVFAMLMLVLGDNLLVLFLGWEGVGLCSYLLIGFFHKEPENGYAARKAFVVTRVGDTLMAIGLFLLFREFGTLEIQATLNAAQFELGRGLDTLHGHSAARFLAAQWASPPRCPCRPGCRTPWPARRRSAH